ncbi:MAG TPA: hypothetical protein VFQ36_07395 [Ktedonobacteraceae bacterium]|nr:hypothetical protein [Ktedonobacteraceae bacterium]
MILDVIFDLDGTLVETEELKAHSSYTPAPAREWTASTSAYRGQPKAAANCRCPCDCSPSTE